LGLRRRDGKNAGKQKERTYLHRAGDVSNSGPPETAGEPVGSCYSPWEMR
jgi:hypothetical protein